MESKGDPRLSAEVSPPAPDPGPPDELALALTVMPAADDRSIHTGKLWSWGLSLAAGACGLVYAWAADSDAGAKLLGILAALLCPLLFLWQSETICAYGQSCRTGRVLVGLQVFFYGAMAFRIQGPGQAHRRKRVRARGYKPPCPAWVGFSFS